MDRYLPMTQDEWMRHAARECAGRYVEMDRRSLSTGIATEMGDRMLRYRAMAEFLAAECAKLSKEIVHGA